MSRAMSYDNHAPGSLTSIWEGSTWPLSSPEQPTQRALSSDLTSMTNESSTPLWYRCPQCGAELQKPTLITVSSAYCRCTQCGHFWHDERVPTKPPSQQRRRKTDAT